MSVPSVVVLDYGSADARPAVAAIERAGAKVVVTHQRSLAMEADGMFVTGVGDFAEALRDLAAVRGAELIERRLAGGRPVLGAGVAMHILFERSLPDALDGLGEWPGELDVHRHDGWEVVDTPADSTLFSGIGGERFRFAHDRAAFDWTLDVIPPFTQAKLAWCQPVEGGPRLLAAVENGPLSATLFRPEESGEAGVRLLRNWLSAL